LEKNGKQMRAFLPDHGLDDRHGKLQGRILINFAYRAHYQEHKRERRGDGKNQEIVIIPFDADPIRLLALYLIPDLFDLQEVRGC
jgi:hypothetical protein